MLIQSKISKKIFVFKIMFFGKSVFDTEGYVQMKLRDSNKIIQVNKANGN